MAIVDTKLLRARKKVFDKLTGKTRDVSTVTLMKQDATTNTFATILAISNSWFYKPGSGSGGFKTSGLLEIARNDATMTTAMGSATHVQIGSDIYVIAQGDTLPPSGFAVTWKIYLELFNKRSQFGSLY